MGATGAARVDRRTKNLTKRLQPGDIAVWNAIALVAASLLPASAARHDVDHGLARRIVIDAAGKDVMTAIEEGQWLRIEDGAVYAVNGSGGAGGPRLASGMQLTPEGVADAMALARENLSGQLQAFAQNTMDYLVREKDLLIDGVGVPDIRTRIEGRHALIVGRTRSWRPGTVRI